jgi:hypothetical protein
MQTLILAVQNAIDRADLGVGTSAVTFFRTLGGAIGSSVLGAILIDQERAARAVDINKYGVKLGPLYAFTHGMDRAFLYAVPVAAVAFALSFLLREIRLKDGSEQPDVARPDSAPVETTLA